MGQPNPYRIGDNQESDLEDDSDDDLSVESFSNHKLNTIVQEMVKQIFEGS
jgi:hypothetical protein